MISEAKKPSKDSSQGLGLPDTIFAGLSFPVVPTNDITVKKHRYSQLTSNPIHEDEEDAEEEVKNGSSSTRSIELSNRSQTVVTPANQSSAQDIKRHFSRLYSNHDTHVIPTNSSSLYPELPDIQSIDISTHERISLLGSQSQSMNHPMVSGHIINQTARAPPSIQMVAMGDRSNDSEQLISDLISQNAQLSEEVAQLRVRLSLAHNNNSEDAVEDRVLVGLDVNHPATGIAMSGGPETMSQTAETSKIKYISCGSCRLWFLAPKEVIFVTCPQCEAINNCGPPKNRSAENNSTVAIQSDFAWLLPCLKGYL